MLFFRVLRSKPATLIALIVVLAFGSVAAHAGQIDASAVGLASPAETITFAEIALPADTVLTNQYASLGVTFSPNAYYNGEIDTPFVNDVANFTDPTEPAFINPVVISFSTPQTAADFQMEADGTPYFFSAFLGGTGGTLVDSFTDPSVGGALFYGFFGETFDTIQISQAGTGGGPYWVLDNIELGTASSAPEPGSMLLIVPALAGLWLVWRRRSGRPLTNA
jgi:hypothetical protein